MTALSASRRHSSPSVPRRGCIDAITVGSVLLHQGRSTSASSRRSCARRSGGTACPRRRTSCRHLDGRCRSMPEAELFAYVVFARLPVPEVNEAVEVVARRRAHARPVVRGLRARGRSTRAASTRRIARQYNADIDRYAPTAGTTCPTSRSPRSGCGSPKATVRLIHAALVVGGLRPGRRRTSGAASLAVACSTPTVRGRRPVARTSVARSGERAGRLRRARENVRHRSPLAGGWTQPTRRAPETRRGPGETPGPRRCGSTSLSDRA